MVAEVFVTVLGRAAGTCVCRGFPGAAPGSAGSAGWRQVGAAGDRARGIQTAPPETAQGPRGPHRGSANPPRTAQRPPPRRASPASPGASAPNALAASLVTRCAGLPAGRPGQMHEEGKFQSGLGHSDRVPPPRQTLAVHRASRVAAAGGPVPSPGFSGRGGPCVGAGGRDAPTRMGSGRSQRLAGAGP